VFVIDYTAVGPLRMTDLHPTSLITTHYETQISSSVNCLAHTDRLIITILNQFLYFLHAGHTAPFQPGKGFFPTNTGESISELHHTSSNKSPVMPYRVLIMKICCFLHSLPLLLSLS
jgi:hypothetical protein